MSLPPSPTPTPHTHTHLPSYTEYPFSKLGNFNTVIQAHLSDMSVTEETGGKKKVGSPIVGAGGAKIESYDEGSDVARNSTLMREMALVMEAKHLPAHYIMDEQTLSKLPTESARDIVRALLLMNEKYRLGAKGAKQIMKHPFFLSIDWDAMKNKTHKAPAKPDTTRASVASGELDLMKLLGTQEGAENGAPPKLTADQQAQFSAFNYNPYTDEAKARRKAREEKFAAEQEAMKSAKVSPEADEYSGSGSLKKKRLSNAANFLEADAISEEKIDSRTGLAITSEAPLDSFDALKKRQDQEEEAAEKAEAKRRDSRMEMFAPGIHPLIENNKSGIIESERG